MVTSYNLEVRDEDGFVGDKAKPGRFRPRHLVRCAAILKRNGDDPLKGKTAEIGRRNSTLLQDGDAREAVLVLQRHRGFIISPSSSVASQG